jgi:hypothetical protein
VLVIPATQGGTGRITVHEKHKTLFENKAKKAMGMDQVAEHLPSKFKALSSNSSTNRKKKK